MTSKFEVMEERRLMRDNREAAFPSQVRTNKMKVTRIIYIITALSQLSVLSLGYEMGISSGALLTLQKAMVLSPQWKQLVIAGALPSALFFTIIASHMSDFLGRKRVVMTASCAYILGSLLSGLAVDKIMLLIGRLFIGIGSGKYILSSVLFTSD